MNNPRAIGLQARPASDPPAPVRVPPFARLDPLVARCSNRWLQPRRALAVTLAGQVFNCKVAAFPVTPAPGLSVGFELGSEVGVLHLPLHWLEHALGRAATLSLQRAQPEQRCLLLEYLFLGALEALETRLGERLNFSPELPPAQALPLRLGLHLSATATATATSALLGLDLSLGAAAGLFEIFNASAPTVQVLPATLPFTLAVQRGWQYLSHDELVSLRTGDVVMLDRPAEGLRVQVAEHLQAFATSIPGGLRLDEALFPMSNHREPLMEQSPAMPGPDRAEAVPREPGGPEGIERDHPDPTLDPSTAQWPVTLACEVGRLELSLQALGELVPGSVLALPGSPDSQARLTANGQPFGRGELVWLGDSLGVRLTSLDRNE